MCGFLFVLHKKNITANECVKSLDLISHRGPDDEGYLVYESQGEDIKIYGRDNKGLGGKDKQSQWNLPYTPHESIEKIANNVLVPGIFMGHRRLSIIDLDLTGHQPMSYLEKRYWIVFNGEIYNYLELKQELMAEGMIFQSNSDTEVIMAAYHKWGEDCLKRFTGMWSFVIFDSQEKRFFGCRDNFGIKPMYYWISEGGTVVMGSEIKQFTAFDEWSAIVNEDMALDYIEHAFLDHTEETLFKNVFQIKPGHAFSFSLKSVPKSGFTQKHLQQYTYRWYYLNRGADILNNEKLTLTEIYQQIKNIFVESIQYHKISDVPVGSALSGGIDSSAVTTVLSSMLGEGEVIKTFTSCSEFAAYDERKWAEEVNKEIKSIPHYNYPKLDDVIENTRKLIWFQDEPYQSQSAMLGYFIYQEANRAGIKVLLNGQGADEYMGGYGQWLLMYESRMFSRNPLKFIKDKLKNRQWAYLLRFLGSKLEVKIFLQFLGKKKRPIKLRVINYNYWNSQRRHVIDQLDYDLNDIQANIEFFIYHATLPKYLHWEDRNSMAHSVEARVPFLDKNLVEYYYHLGSDILAGGRSNKPIFREAVKSYLPWTIYKRKDKKGFVTPEEEWVKHVNPEYFRSKLSSALIVLGNRFDKSKMLKLFEDQLSGSKSFDNLYWRIILFVEWMDVFQVKFQEDRK